MDKHVISNRCVNCRHRSFFIHPQVIQGLKIEDRRNKEDRKLLSPSKFRALDEKGSMCHSTIQFHLQSANIKSPLIWSLWNRMFPFYFVSFDLFPGSRRGHTGEKHESYLHIMIEKLWTAMRGETDLIHQAYWTDICTIALTIAKQESTSFKCVNIILWKTFGLSH